MRTIKDLQDYLLAFSGDQPQYGSLMQTRNAAVSALRELANSYNWSYYYRPGRIATVAPYSTGTITYTHTGGTYERLVTLASGTWPSWAASGLVYISSTAYEVDERRSDTLLTLKAASNPGTDVAAGTSYVLYREMYPLPTDFKSAGSFTIARNAGLMQFVHPSRWLDLSRNFVSSGTPTTYCIFGDNNTAGRMSIAFHPFADSARQVDFVYQRRCQPITTFEYKTGAATLTSGSASVSGSGVTWTSAMIGSVARFSADATNFPTDGYGANPAVHESLILDVPTSTTLRLADAAPATYSAIKYVISDLVDIEDSVMGNALLRCGEKHIAHIKRMSKDIDRIEAAWREELLMARGADSRSFAARAGESRTVMRYGNMPLGADN